jgi:hypothetical protein
VFPLLSWRHLRFKTTAFKSHEGRIHLLNETIKSKRNSKERSRKYQGNSEWNWDSLGGLV